MRHRSGPHPESGASVVNRKLQTSCTQERPNSQELLECNTAKSSSSLQAKLRNFRFTFLAPALESLSKLKARYSRSPGMRLALIQSANKKSKEVLLPKLVGEWQSLLGRMLFEKRGLSYGSQRARRKGRIARPVGTGRHWRSSDVLTLPKFVA